MKKHLKTLVFLSLTLLFLACSGYGKKLDYNGTEVYYTSKVDKTDAEKLGDYLIRSKFADGGEKSIQLTKDEKTNNFVFRMVTTKEASESKMYETVFELFAKTISDSVFNKLPVDFHVCDNTFNTLKVISFKDNKED
ncbi:hypothetical protein [Polaribacter uvawellassae]|uniref:hypothetical protein n=1 Tax=Polaribacter uvawellassae TaxID=3133495 RepID=UPI00321979BA